MLLVPSATNRPGAGYIAVHRPDHWATAVVSTLSNEIFAGGDCQWTEKWRPVRGWLVMMHFFDHRLGPPVGGQIKSDKVFADDTEDQQLHA